MSSDADKYEGDETQAATASSTPGNKYYQIVVPGFTEGTATGPTFANVIDASGNSAGSVPSLGSANSFLRLGTPPSPNSDWSATPYQNSVKLARLVGDPWVIAAAENMTLNSAKTSITGTVTDSSTASSLVPSSSSASSGTSKATSATDWSSNFKDGSGNPSITSDDSNTFGALYDVAGDGSKYGNAFNTNQDASYFPGFADDTRQRGSIAQSQANGANLTCPATTNVSNTAVANMPQNRQAETLKLLSKGGWWDHSDGNRVTTTSGDKIEVIQGNYKLVVLGRQSVPSPPTNNTSDVDRYRKDLTSLAANAFITDVSGGHFQEQYPSPTPCIKTIEYVQDDNGEWTLYQDNGLGNLITRLKGRTVDLFQGPSREAYVGSSDKTVLYATGYTDPNNSSASADQTKPASSTNPTDTDLRLDPVVILEDVGAERVQPGRLGGQAHRVRRQRRGDPVGPAPGSASTGDVVNLTWAMRVRNYTGSLATHVTHLYSETHADEIQTYTFGESSVTINGVLNTFELSMGVKESVALGLQASLFVGRKVDVCIGPSQNFAADLTDIKGIHEVLTVEKSDLTAQRSTLVGRLSNLVDEHTEVLVEGKRVVEDDITIAMVLSALAPELNLGL